MDGDSDEEYDHVSEYELSACESDDERIPHSTPATTPPLSTSQQSAVKTIPCPRENCYKVFSRQIRLKEHLRSHTNERPYECPYPACSKTYMRDTQLNHHVKSAHSDVRDYKCTWEGCDASFATGTRLRRHIQTHEGKERFRCRGYDGCNETFRKHDTLRRHVMSVHEQMKPFPCSDLDPITEEPCDKAFDTAEKLRQHQRTRHNPTRFSCSECLSSIAATTATGVHEHADDMPRAYFTTYGELQEHIAHVHPPSCSFCPTSFITNRELTRHLEVQHGIPNPNLPSRAPQFDCVYDGCTKTFSKQGNLNVHVRTYHENKRDFLCGKTTILLPEEVHPDVEVYGCGRAFTTKASLEEHVRTAHLGLASRRSVQKKRKAEKDGGHTDREAREPRKARKDKGVKKTSAIADLIAGQAQNLNRSHIPSTVHNFVKSEFQNQQDVSCAQKTEDDHPAEDDEADCKMLSGSMTLYGNHIYHASGQWHYPSGQYKSGHRPPPSMENSFFSTHGDDEADEGDGFFGDLEHDVPAYFTDSLG